MRGASAALEGLSGIWYNWGMKTANLRFATFVAAASAAISCFAMLDDEAALKAARETLAKMTLEEKALLTGGSGTMTLSAIPRVGITKEWTMSDNSSTVRPQMNRWDWGYTKPRSENTKLPSLSALASTWDVELARLHGEVLGAEMRDRGVDELLGPGVNIARTPLNGRNWEYLGEDPCLSAKMCVPMIKGVQSYDVAATVKHFCLNDQEWNRNNVDTHCDLRTLHEIYLPAFRAAVQEAGVLCVMTSYNKIDGIWASENKYLQTGVLRDRWGFKGLVETDWGGQHSNEFSANNGGGIEMDRGDQIKFHYNPKAKKFPIVEAVKAGKISEATVDEMALHVLFVMAKTGFLTGAPRKAGERNTKKHQEIARLIGEESIVLAKNEKGVLPLDAKSLKKVLVIGKNAAEKQCHKGCSAEGNVPYEVTFLDALKARLGKGVEIVLKPLPKDKVKKTDDAQLAVDLSGVERAGGHVEKDEGKGKAEGPGLDELKALALASDATIVFTGTELGYDGNMAWNPSMERGCSASRMVFSVSRILLMRSIEAMPLGMPYAALERSLIGWMTLYRITRKKMKVGASMGALSLRMRVPPNHSTMAIMMVPRHSLTGCARAWRVATRVFLTFMASVTRSKRRPILRSARKALMMRRPPSVSSTWLMVSLHRACASRDCSLSLRPILPMIHSITGANSAVKRVICHEMNSSTAK